MFRLDLTMEDARIIATGSGTCDDPDGRMPWLVEFHDNMSGKSKTLDLTGIQFGELLHTLMADDGNGTSRYYNETSELLELLKLPTECRPIA